MRQRRHNRTAGFSLIEVVVGIALLGLVTAPVCASLVLSVRLNSHSQALMNARLQASGVVETLLAEGVNVDATVGEGENKSLVWGEDSGSWTRTMDGAVVTAEKNDEDDSFYKVTVTCTVGEEEVVFTTQVRDVTPPPSEPESEGDA